MTEPSLEAYAAQILQETCAAFPMRYEPKIAWKRLRVTAGVAFYRTGVIGLSSLVLTDPERLRSTLLHEYAHLLAVDRHGAKGKGHGRAWREAMHDLGLEPKVTHAYDVQRNTTRQEVAYSCLTCGATLTRRRRLPRGRKYVHARCGGGLKLVYVKPVTKEPNVA